MTANEIANAKANANANANSAGADGDGASAGGEARQMTPADCEQGPNPLPGVEAGGANVGSNGGGTDVVLGSNEVVSLSVFHDAEREVFHLLEHDSFPRFKKSREWLLFLAEGRAGLEQQFSSV